MVMSPVAMAGATTALQLMSVCETRPVACHAFFASTDALGHPVQGHTHLEAFP